MYHISILIETILEPFTGGFVLSTEPERQHSKQNVRYRTYAKVDDIRLINKTLQEVKESMLHYGTRLTKQQHKHNSLDHNILDHCSLTEY